jgi:hypothetical protein
MLRISLQAVHAANKMTFVGFQDLTAAGFRISSIYPPPAGIAYSV